MREQIWLEWFCRQAAKTIKPTETPSDPRYSFAIYVEQGMQALRLRAADPVEHLWYSGLRPFSAPYLDINPNLHKQDREGVSPHLALLVTRGTANLLGGARAPVGGEQYWRTALADDRSIYVDVPNGSILVGDNEGLGELQLRAVFLPPIQPSTSIGSRPFIAVMTAPGSELPLGRLCGSLDADGRTSRLAGAVSADFGLQPPYANLSVEGVAREAAADFIRLVIAYYLFGPAEAHDTLTPTLTKLLRNGKPRSDQGLFAITRLRAASDRLGRPNTNKVQRWVLTTRQEIAGHFKLQAYGPGASLRRLIWIEAYERGREGGPIRPKAAMI